MIPRMFRIFSKNAHNNRKSQFNYFLFYNQ
ncbi:hypothetical protein SBA3_2880016 [Candidatus Sulfopaludibacter sp. SbA3]|nr:hypothetical protein SBA3_2880016 [Candidatus Sulfopaludibacter sp. SbA3]